MDHISLICVFVFYVHACDALCYLCCVIFLHLGFDTSEPGVNLDKNTTHKTCTNRLPNIAHGNINSLSRFLYATCNIL